LLGPPSATPSYSKGNTPRLGTVGGAKHLSQFGKSLYGGVCFRCAFHESPVTSRGSPTMSQLTFNLQPTRTVLTVSELTARIRDLLARNFTDIFVQGEISNCREAQSGHIYLTLKDDRAQVRCVFFKQQRRGIKFRPEDGLQVTVRGSISVYEQRGEYQIYVENLQPVGRG